MKEKLPRITAGKVDRVLENLGFVLFRRSGSHRIYKNREGNRVIVPYHAKKGSPPKGLKKCLRDTDLTVERFRELVE